MPDPASISRPERPGRAGARALLLALLLLLGAAGAPGEEERNLVPNGDFDGGDPGASKIPGWTEVDGLTTFFEAAPGRGRVLRIDTDVNLSEANARWKEMELPASRRPPPKPKGPTRPPKYDTVGGTTGAKIYSDYLRVEPGMRYRLRVDVKSDGPTVKVFVKGYAKLEGGFRKFYQCYKNVEKPRPGWHTYERTFNPTARSPKVTHIRVMPYAYWPPGNAWIDQVEIRRLGREAPPGAASARSLLAHGDFEEALAPWTAKGSAARVVRGAEGACARIDAGASLTSAPVKLPRDGSYVLRARVLPAGGVLTAVFQGLVRFSGEWVALTEREESLPPKADGWLDLEVSFRPAEEAPQVSHVRVRFEVRDGEGSAFVDDVRIEPAGAEADDAR